MPKTLPLSALNPRVQTSGPRAPHRLQWLSDNGSIHAGAKTIDVALALNLDPDFALVESPESNGIPEPS